MFEVKGYQILVDEVEVLKTLKSDVLLRTGRNILHKIKRSHNNIMICCPNHNDGQEKNPSCGVSTVRNGNKPAGTVHCFTCGYTSNFTSFISKCFGYDDKGIFGHQWLMENFITGMEQERPDIVFDFSRDNKPEQIKYVTEEELRKYRFYHPYMYKRRLTNEVIELYDIGYQRGYKENDKWLPTDVITFPVRDIKGNVLFIARRSIIGKTFFLPAGIQKPIYGLYELPKNCNEVIICESVFNALTCRVYGKPAVALFGTGDVHQYEILRNLPIRKYILALDPDTAGEKGTEKLKHNLRNKLLSKLIIPKGKDINDLSLSEFKSLKEILI